MKKLFSIFSSDVDLNKELNRIDLQGSFISFSINKDSYQETIQNRLIQIHGAKKVSLNLGLKDKILGDFNGKKIEIKNNDDFINLNKFFDRLYFHMIEESKKLIRPASELTSSIDEENKSLEWLKVSLMMLKNAIAEIRVKKDLLYQGRVFFGKRSKEANPEFRIQSLSLDILLEFLPDHRLRFRVWNLKDGQKTAQDKEDLFAEFVTLKGPVFDEIILLINEIRQVSFI